MLRTIAIVFGFIMVAVGLLGFYPPAVQGSKLLGWFAINPFHNIIHLLTGVVSIGCGFKTTELSRVFFRVFGIIYGLVAIAGFYYMDHAILGLVANNLADAVLHLAIAAGAIYLGFFYKTRSTAKS